MKLILGDNQFFGINHHDLNKGNQTKLKFSSEEKISDFISETINLGLDGFMINSNNMGYNIVKDFKVKDIEEIHFSIPYPHKYATMVNEAGMLSLLKYFISKTSIMLLTRTFPKFILTRNVKYLLPLVINLEIPKGLQKGSTIYMQNIVTDLILGLNRFDLLEAFSREVRIKGYKPGIITLNPVLLDSYIKNSTIVNRGDVTICFNINEAGFNVFPSKETVVNFVKQSHNYKLMGMSVFSSGGGDIKKSIKFIKNLKLDYIVFGSSKIENIKKNIQSFRS